MIILQLFLKILEVTVRHVHNSQIKISKILWVARIKLLYTALTRLFSLSTTKKEKVVGLHECDAGWIKCLFYAIIMKTNSSYMPKNFHTSFSINAI